MNIAAAFDRAVDYERHARVQGDVATALGEMILAQPIEPGARVLEIGCGTGMLGGQLVDQLPDAQWLMTDIAPLMVARTAARFGGHPRVKVAIMDGENPPEYQKFNLICSSLAMQWFMDLPLAIDRLRSCLAPGGLLAFTTLAEGSFAEWRAAHGALEPGVRVYPTHTCLENLGLQVSIEHHSIRHIDARDFLHSLKAIGAGTPRGSYRPLPPAELRKVMAHFEESGSIASYVVATCALRG